jgi:DNA-binding transcriptional ArsR family regulator
MKGAEYHKCFEPLANKLRIKIIQELQKKPMTIQELSKKTGAEQSRISHSMNALKKCNHVQTQKKGKYAEYKLSSEILTNLNKKHTNIFEAIELHTQKYCKKCNTQKKGEKK